MHFEHIHSYYIFLLLTILPPFLLTQLWNLFFISFLFSSFIHWIQFLLPSCLRVDHVLVCAWPTWSCIIEEMYQMTITLQLMVRFSVYFLCSMWEFCLELFMSWSWYHNSCKFICALLCLANTAFLKWSSTSALLPPLPWKSLNPGLGMLYEYPIYDWEFHSSLFSVSWLVGGLFANCHLTKNFSDLCWGMFWYMSITINS